MAKKALPGKFIENITGYIGAAEAEKLISALSAEPCSGLRINTLRVSVDEYMRMSPFRLDPVPWCKDGFYYDSSAYPGRHPHYYAGLYYIQEPSAMFPVEVLAPLPGETILDLCAAPGGKTVQIAARMENKGLLVSNDNNPKRVKALMKNIELCGVRNACISCLEPIALAAGLPGYFDGILLDAPCSGEGMFRRDEHAVRSWCKHSPESYVRIQMELLKTASLMLKPGGRIVYSTCTFSPDENENLIAAFIEQNSDFSLAPIDLTLPGRAGIESGKCFESGGFGASGNVARLWPHKLKAEGHFTALLYKNASSIQSTARRTNWGTRPEFSNTPPSWYSGFVRDNFLEIPLLSISEGLFCTVGDNLYYCPREVPDMDFYRFIKLGLFLGTKIESKFKPSHSSVLCFKRTEFKRILDINADCVDALRYLKGETLNISGEKGLTIVCVDGFTLGWAYHDGNMFKNLYPSGWRMLR